MSPTTITLTEQPDGSVEAHVNFGVPEGQPFEITPARALAMMMLAYFRDCEMAGRAPLPILPIQPNHLN